MVKVVIVVVLFSLLGVADSLLFPSTRRYASVTTCPPVTCHACSPGYSNQYYDDNGCMKCLCVLYSTTTTVCPPESCTCAPGQTTYHSYSGACRYCYCGYPTTHPTTHPPCPIVTYQTCQQDYSWYCDFGSGWCPNCTCRHQVHTSKASACTACPNGDTPSYPSCSCWQVTTIPPSAGLPSSRLLDMLRNVQRNAQAVEQLASNLESEVSFVYDMVQSGYFHNRARRDAVDAVAAVAAADNE